MSTPTLNYSSSVTEHLHCAGCGYDLYLTDPNDRCPECGREVAPQLVLTQAIRSPFAATRARRMSMSLLLSSVFAGLCPAVCVLTLSLGNLLGAVLMSLVFLACAFFAEKGERLRSQLVGVTIVSRRRRSVLLADLLAGVGLLLINLGAYTYFIGEIAERMTALNTRDQAPATLSLIGTGFFLLCITAWRAVPTWRSHAEIARQFDLAAPARFLVFLAWTKAIYETAWLLCCWMPFLLLAVDAEDAAIGFAYGSFLGLLGFAVVWLLMIIAHAILARKIYIQSAAMK